MSFWKRSSHERNKTSTDLHENHDGVFQQMFSAGDAQEVGVKDHAEGAREQEDDTEHDGRRRLQERQHLRRQAELPVHLKMFYMNCCV